jgi:hypothetical protein
MIASRYLRPQEPNFVPAKIDHLALEANPFSIFFPGVASQKGKSFKVA